MRATRLQMGPTFRDKLTDSVKSFNRKHKYLRIFGFAYAMVALFFYDIGIHFCHNIKRYTCLASVLFFFVASSSFTYPEAMSLNISFVADNNQTDTSADEVYYTSESLKTSIEESDAVLADVVEIDPEIVLEKDSITTELDEETTDNSISIDELDLDNVDKNAVESQNDDGVFDASDWKLILVNKQHPIPDDYVFPLGNLNETMYCDERVITPLKTMLKAASDDGIGLVICSPYRDSERQEGLFARKINYYMGAGLSYMEAYNQSSQAVTVPGSSEHQIGMAFDIVCPGYYDLDEGFGNTEAGKWLAANSYKYGFVVRYPKGKENITSIEYEPWHFRYVGVDAAKVMYEDDICLEEFWDNYMYD